ncbi:hypothetical protein M8C21_029233 [Ambrosia artemisiifolia]|uniref:Rubisco LSMT substrate-binding domain-containing protein n=1 Tax=Ambrosia artemisiifolia TaxID=4212 RepID=A0AAD5D424_AMBAR|nr:hypothetical protein M8C21_029233 [Ambrosia artemisiifolia]
MKFGLQFQQAFWLKRNEHTVLEFNGPFGLPAGTASASGATFPNHLIHIIRFPAKLNQLRRGVWPFLDVVKAQVWGRNFVRALHWEVNLWQQLAPDNLHPSVNSLLGEDVGSVAKLALVILLHQSLGQVIADENYAPGDEVLIRYGKFSNARLLLDFGFIIPRNKYDQVKVEVNASQHDHLHALKLDLLHRHTTPSLKDVDDLSSQENGFMVKEVKSSSGKGRGIPQSLRALARVLCCTSPQELQDLAMEATQNDGRLARVPLKNTDKEVEAHQLLHMRFSHMIENYNSALESLSHHSSEKHTQRMQLARDLLTGELRILESASAWLKNYCQTLKPTWSVRQVKKI